MHPDPRSLAIPRITSKVSLLVPFVCSLVGACTSPNDGPTIDRQTSAVSATDPAVLKAQNDAQNMQARQDRIESLKKQLAVTSASDRNTQSSLIAQVVSEEAAYAAAIPGVIGIPPGAVASPPPDPQLAARARLLAKLSAYDMTKPEDVAAWARLKKQELGQ